MIVREIGKMVVVDLELVDCSSAFIRAPLLGFSGQRVYCRAYFEDRPEEFGAADFEDFSGKVIDYQGRGLTIVGDGLRGEGRFPLQWHATRPFSTRLFYRFDVSPEVGDRSA